MHKKSIAISIGVSFVERNSFTSNITETSFSRNIERPLFISMESNLMQKDRQWSEKRKDEIELEMSLSYPEIGLEARHQIK